jgi:hypothetical protein
MNYKKSILYFLLAIIFVALFIGKTNKNKENFINYSDYVEPLKKIHSQFRMDSTYKVKEYTEYFHSFLRKWYIIY